jgi:hypothetical protein
MIADVVAWKVSDELPFDELNEAIEWVIQAQKDQDPVRLPDDWPALYITPCPQRNVVLPRGGNSKLPVSTVLEHAIVVTNEPCTPKKASELWDKYIEGLKEVKDEEHQADEDDLQSEEA